MVLNKLWEYIEQTVFPVASRGELFNFYKDEVSHFDLSGAAELRRNNLRSYLKSFNKCPGVLVVGEAPGWRGCRFSGVPFTSEAQLQGNMLPFTGEQTSKRPFPYNEATAEEFWVVMKPYFKESFVWNSIPFHPHQPGNLLSNRTPQKSEIQANHEILKGVLSFIHPKWTLAVGRKAEKALKSMGVYCYYVRHPARGGKLKFAKGIKDFWENIEE